MENTSIAILSIVDLNPVMEESSEMQPWNPVSVGLRLEAAREALGLKKSEFADRLDYDRSSYTKVEKGEKPLLSKEAYKIYRLFGIDMNYFFLGRMDGVPASLSSKITEYLNKAKS